MSIHTQATDPAVMSHIRDLHTLVTEARAFKARVDSFKTTWQGGLNALFNADTDTWDEGRQTEGIFPPTSLIVNQEIGELFKISTGGSAEFNSQILDKMAVGPL